MVKNTLTNRKIYKFLFNFCGPLLASQSNCQKFHFIIKLRLNPQESIKKGQRSWGVKYSKIKPEYHSIKKI